MNQLASIRIFAKVAGVPEFRRSRQAIGHFQFGCHAQCRDARGTLRRSASQSDYAARIVDGDGDGDGPTVLGALHRVAQAAR